MEFISDVGGFLVKAVILVAALIIIIGVIANAAQRKKDEKGELHIRNLSNDLRDTTDKIRLQLLDKKERKKSFKKLQKERKAQAKGGSDKPEQRLFVIDFHGSMDAHEVASLTREVNAVLAVATSDDAVFVRLESGGGVVHGYGLGAAQLQRLRDHGLRVHVSVDKVAASGGYMMACIAHEIHAAPFAIVGSIGVIAQLPNFHRWLKKHDVDFEQLTAGEYKRTLTLFGENTEQGRQKFKDDLENIHKQFKSFVKEHRPEVDIDKVATGEIWTGQEAIELKLVDEVITSDAWLLKRVDEYRIYKVEYQTKKGLGERLGRHTTAMLRSLKEFVAVKHG
ncbi:inner membrane peptidase. Serine peptidase. MEROPS family S49 [Pseudidiomarina planktonica]|uniref:Inner membrane peptidase. Serine peptidase. MEROPS family S49 n=1 Tax=Pseudidiomarina planktonica TaxID=1323738 RepID=A0A1Y6EKE2_9GAMM|nr:protease SohB [Pseudidiomarina planktonica]RUO65750.1 protease SohB [Pseudidiomarina planktonica]SMQ63067.1 inner membrane peptidase. Serine peptidase. MEROPS family S49 [Pseudidiomarina planktonica]